MGRRGIVREEGRDLQRDVTVDTTRASVDRGKQVGRPSEVGQGQVEEDRLVRLTPGGAVSNVDVVGAGATDRLVEDRRVRGQASDRQVGDVARERAGVEQVARDVVEPEPLAQAVELPRGVHRVS